MTRFSRILAAVVASASLAAALRGQAVRPMEIRPDRGVRNTYGTTVESYYRMTAAEFTPVAASVGYLDEVLTHQYSFRRFGSPGVGIFVGSPHLPSGALLTYFELDSCDFNASQDVLADLFGCDYHGDCGSDPLQEIDSQNNVTPNACSYAAADISGLGLTVNNYGGQVEIMVRTLAGDDTTTFSGVILGYKLQVAPAPATATFNDVQPSDFGYQYIEALAASGITGGCGGGNFCPNAPLKRSQMAVFLAKALGLYLPHY